METCGRDGSGWKILRCNIFIQATKSGRSNWGLVYYCNCKLLSLQFEAIVKQHQEELAQSGKQLSKEEQLTFRRDCLRLLNDLRGPSGYLDKVRRRFSLEREVYPGMKVLNLVFEDARIPYRIRNKQAAKTKQDLSRDTYWTIEKIPMAKESEHPLQDAPKLRD